MKDKVFWLRAYGFFLIVVLIAASAWVVTHPLAQPKVTPEELR
jgi:hypothetical protein